jgi:pimeloyl-ACP methyl ester carboxylesterase
VTNFATSHDGVRVPYAIYGGGRPALVLIHGWSCNSTYWAAQVATLSERFRVITLDLGGHGQASTGRASWTMDSFGRDVSAVVDAAGLEQVVLVGHSMGGNVAVAAALHLGKQVQGMIWVDTYKRLGAPRSPEEIQQVLAPFRADFQKTTEAYVRGMFPAGADKTLVRRVAKDMAASPPSIAVAALEASLIFGRTITQTLEGVEARIIAINADEPPTDVPSMRRHGVEVVTMRGVGHFPMMEAAERFNSLLDEIVSERLSTSHSGSAAQA